MTTTLQSTHASGQITAWLRGLLAIAWADGDFDPEEQNLIASLTEEELAPSTNLKDLGPITPAELGQVLGRGTPLAENFLRTAVMVALADGVYSASEDELLQQFCTELGQQDEVLTGLRQTLYNLAEAQASSTLSAPATPLYPDFQPEGAEGRLDVLKPTREWLDGLEIHDPRLARFLCKMIPPQCPFERDITLFGQKIVHIPPLCKLNPLYEQLVGLRFRALSYLADDCHEDVSPYC